MEGDETSQISTTWDLTRLRLFALALDVCFFSDPGAIGVLTCAWELRDSFGLRCNVAFRSLLAVNCSIGKGRQQQTLETVFIDTVNIYIYVYIYIHIDTHILKMVRTPLFIGSHMSNRQNCCINNTNLVFLRLGLSEVAQNLN